MIKLLIIADDFTGALDTGVQFSEKGIETRVIVDDRQKGSSLRIKKSDTMQVLVVDAETRHMTSEDAYQKVFAIVKEAKKAEIPYIYKKTDSALRGNIGSELSALLNASEEKNLPFIPAFPKMKRITKNGVHYIDDIPVSESVFGRDPFEPVTRNRVKEIIHLQSEVKVAEVLNLQITSWEEPGIWVFDASKDEEIEEIANLLKERNAYKIMAGCAGFASILPKLLGLQGSSYKKEKLEQQLLVICGSVNPITIKQLEHGESCGYQRIHLTAEQKLKKEYWMTEKGNNIIQEWMGDFKENSCCILDSNDTEKGQTLDYAKQNDLSIDQVRCRISETLGIILRKILDQGLKAVLLVTGGDTLLGFMKEIDDWELKPICEIFPGCVLTKLIYKNEEYHIITKSGGFGEEKLLENIVDVLKK